MSLFTFRLPRHLLLLTTAGFLTGLAGCGGGGGDSAPASTAPVVASTTLSAGVFLDAPVQGLRVVRSSGATVTTGSFGEFQYIPGETVTFFLGALRLGSATAKAEITPLDLFATNDPNNRQVVNLLRLLQSLDSNDNLADGIQLSESVLLAAAGSLAKISLNQDTGLFTSSVDVAAVLAKKRPGLTLPSIAAALSHFESTRQMAGTAGLYKGNLTFDGQTLATSGLGGVMGVYNGNYLGSDSKRYTVMLQSASSGRAQITVFSTTRQVTSGGTFNLPSVKSEDGALTSNATEIRFTGDSGTNLVVSKTGASAMPGVKTLFAASGGVGMTSMCPNGAFVVQMPYGYGIDGAQYVGLAYFGPTGLEYAIKPLISIGGDKTTSGSLRISGTAIEFTLPSGKLTVPKVTAGSGFQTALCS